MSRNDRKSRSRNYSPQTRMVLGTAADAGYDSSCDADVVVPLRDGLLPAIDRRVMCNAGSWFLR